MYIVAICTCIMVTVVGAVSHYDYIKEDFEAFKSLYNKSYEHELEEKFRLMIYADNALAVETHNARYDQGLETYRVALNQYSDLLDQEFLLHRTGYQRHNVSEEPANATLPSELSSRLSDALPDSVDWREKGAVTEVKNQGDCDSCFTFSATGALEAQHFLKSGALVSLSEQNLVDCMPPGQNCLGGYMSKAFDFIKSNNGIDTEASYAYEAADGKCRFKKENVGATCTGYVQLPKGDEQRLKQAVATVGPVCTAVDSTHPGFRHYSTGVHYEKACGEPNHAVLVVGYGTTEKGEAYWLVKNSWGPDWGLKGYIMMARDRDSNCGIASDPVYPTV